MELLRDPEFWILVAFVVVIVLLWKPAGRAVTKALDDRAEKIRLDLDRAAKLRTDAQNLLAEYQQKQHDALKDAEAILAQAKADAERLSAQAAADLEASLKRREQMALQRIAQAEQQALAEVRAAAVDIAIAATGKLLSEKLDAAQQDALVDGAIKELQGKLN
ncbi:MAG TPA: F0F1 ATP synthase subunit B [Alphaproteobacteria bacterium]|nr:F0F1 ATP synthase subunit B [Alphaproteobacteria bacterium]